MPSARSSWSAAAGKREHELTAAAGRRLDPDPAAVDVNDSLADGQADTRARILVGAVQTREHAEDALGLRRVDADPVVPNAEAPAVGHLGRPDADARRLVAGELDRVRDQVLEQLAQSARVPGDRRQRSDLDVSTRIGDR